MLTTEALHAGETRHTPQPGSRPRAASLRAGCPGFKAPLKAKPSDPPAAHRSSHRRTGACCPSFSVMLSAELANQSSFRMVEILGRNAGYCFSREWAETPHRPGGDGGAQDDV